MANIPKVSIVLLNYNGWKDTLECLESLKKLAYPDFSVIVVDNASPNESWEKIKNWKDANWPSVNLVQSGSNKGYGGGNNVGIRQSLSSGAQYVWILNNDTVAEPETLNAMMETALAKPKIGLVGPTTLYLDSGSVQALAGGAINPWLAVSRFKRKEFQRLDYISGASILASADCLREIGFFDEKFFMYWEDADLSYRAKAAGWNILHAPKARLWHKEGGTIRHYRFLADYHHARSGLLFYLKHKKKHYFPAPFMFALLKITHRIIRFHPQRLLATLRGLLSALKSA